MMTVVSSFLLFSLFGLATLGLMTIVAFGKFLMFVLGALCILALCYACVAGIDRAAAKCFGKEPSSLLEIAKAALHSACWLTMIGLGVLIFRAIFL